MLLAGELILGAQSFGSQPARIDTVLSLEQCLDMAKRNNAVVKTSNNAVASAKEQRKEAFTRYFPTVSAGMMMFQANHDMLQYDVNFPKDFPIPLDPLHLGLIKKGHGLTVAAMQPVFAGGRIVNGNKLAKVGEQVALLERENNLDNLHINVDNLYWQLVTLKGRRETLVKAIALLDSIAAQVKVSVDAGLITRNDLLRVELQRNGYRQDMVDLDNGIDLVKMLMSQTVGLGPHNRVDVCEEIPEQLPAAPDELFMNTSEALPSTANFKLLEKQVEARELEKKMEIGNNLPTVGIGGGWFQHKLLGQNHNFAAVMLTVSVPISGWWGGSHAIKRRSLALENARTELTNLSEQLQIQMTDRWDNLTSAYRKMQLAEESKAQSKENLRLTRAYFDAGMNTITDLLDAQMLHQQSQSEYVSAYGQFRLSEAQYLNATGRLKY